MACFTVPLTEAIITTIIKKRADKKATRLHMEITNSFIKRMNWLNHMLWGGSALLAFEHIWHGEVTSWFPFFINTANPEEAAVMLNEIATTGVTMAFLVTSVWAVIVLVANSMEKRAISECDVSFKGGSQ